MKHHPVKTILWFVALFVAVSLACGGPPATEEPPNEPKEPVVEKDVSSKESTDNEPEVVASSGAVSNLQDVKGAVIQIEATGTFVDPEGGEYTGAGRGSGFIIDPSGIAVTNHHVVTGAGLLKVWIGGDTSIFFLNPSFGCIQIFSLQYFQFTISSCCGGKVSNKSGLLSGRDSNTNWIRAQ